MAFLRRKEILRPPVKRYSRGAPLSMWERYLERGLAYWEKNNLQEALIDLDEAIITKPNIGELYAIRGLILFQMGRNDDAEEDLDEALHRDKHQWVTFYVRGLMAMKKKDFETAIEQFSQAQRYVPSRPEVLHSRAMAYYGQGNLDLAIADLETALEDIEKSDKIAKEIKKLMDQFKKENT